MDLLCGAVVVVIVMFGDVCLCGILSTFRTTSILPEQATHNRSLGILAEESPSSWTQHSPGPA